MPEGKYPAHVKRERRTWKRPRWFTPLVRGYWDVDVESGIPVPGKGENSWDCDDDAIFASSFSVNKAETAYMAGKCVAMDALRPAIGTRALVGYRWRPNPAAPISWDDQSYIVRDRPYRPGNSSSAVLGYA